MTRDKLMSELLTGCQMPLFGLRVAAHSEIERLTRRLQWIAAHSCDEATKDFAKMALSGSKEAK